ncbi:hypothetical protein HDU99_004465 [Rhizoclosmatium hyalinum]|nr:hypothetical protein HDU99_004465 [Rhizoclosmatium hyalinum]
MGKRQIQREALDINNTPVPTTPLQRYGRVTNVRGGGLYDILITDEAGTGTQMKFHKVIWVKLGAFVLVELLEEVATKIHGDILSVLRPEHVKLLRTDNAWPSVLDPPVLTPATVEVDQDSTEDEAEYESGSDNDDDLFVNRNRMHVEEESDDDE